MRKNKLIFSAMALLAAFIMATSVSCKKDDDDSSKSKTDLISGKNWVITAITVNPPIEFNGIELSDLFSIMPDCSKDDFIVFKTDGTVIFDEGATKCDAGDPQQTSGTWVFQENESKISTTADGETEVYTLIELEESRLKVSVESIEDLGNGEKTYIQTVTFAAN